MAGQLEDSQDAHDAEDLHHPAHILELVRRVLVGLQQEQGHKVGQYGEQIDNVEATLEKLPLVRRGAKPEDVLEREPGDADRLHHRQLGIVLRGAIVIGLQGR